LALLDYPGSTLLGVMRILVDKTYRDKVVEKIKDPVVKSFWVNEFTKWNERNLQEVVSPIQNKVGQFLSNFLIRNIIGQVKSTFDLREVIDNNKILIMNLSKGRIGEDTMQLLGSSIVTKLYLAAMSRVDIPEEDRKDFYLYVDEFQNFATDAFADILSEARKYKLNLIMAHQFIEQLPETVSAAVFGNVGTLICFRVGAADADVLVKEFTPTFTEEDLVNLPAFSIYLKLMIDGISSDPFSANTLPPLFDEYRTSNNEKVLSVSRERYANPRDVVEDKINRWSGMDLSEKMVATLEGRTNFETARDKERKRKPRIQDSRPLSAEKKKEETYTVDCFDCGKKTEINFFPDGKRPVFCKDCLAKNRKEKQRTINKRPDMGSQKPVMKIEKDPDSISLADLKSKLEKQENK
jgi:CxxC-x17-CxxC domain-containing protein